MRTRAALDQLELDGVSGPRRARQAVRRTSTTAPSDAGLSVRRKPRPPRLALTRAEAAESLGMSVDSLERYVQPEVRLVRRGTLRLVPVTELESWLRGNASHALRPGD
jgi:hypothetical protein